MAAAIAIWSLHVPAGKKTVHVPQADIRITGASLDATLADKDGRASIRLTYASPTRAEDEDDEKPPEKTAVILASLTPDKIEQAHLDLIISEEEPVEFEVVGKNSVYLSGNYILQPSDFPAAGESEDEGEESFDPREVSSDIEVNEDDLDIPSSEEEDVSHRFEEVIEEPETEEKAEAPSKKRPREEEDAEGEQKLSKKQRRKQKQQQGEEAIEPVTKAAGEKGKKEEKKGEKKEKVKEGPAKPKAELETRPSGLQIKDVKEGTGKTAKSGDLVGLRYIGKMKDGKVFDSNTKGKPFTFRVGAGEVIKGWDEGIQGMKIGGERLLIVPPKLGYGNRKQADIPPSSTLHFEVKLLEIK